MAVGTAELQILINAKDEASGTFKKLGGTLGKFAKIAAVGVGTLAVGAGAATVAAVKMAASYETAMKEVATLGVPEEQMKVLEEGVLDLSRRLGVDAVEATGALYQAISAGVPPENALAFLETASKAAIAGVTDAETAVDGISTVVNAFAGQNITATQAADIMFETVKGGKTTFEQLSASIANVAPLASATGVSFEEVSAALATMTASGTDTSVATTQIRSAIQALTKPSEGLTAIFEAAGFASGEAAVEELGFAKAGEIVAKATGGSVSEMTKLLGSIEGVQGVLGVTGDQAGTFADNVEAMADSAGAADAAFDVMSGSFEFQMGRVKQSFKTGMIEVGLQILPVITPIMEALADKLPAAIDATVGKIKDFATVAKDIRDRISEVRDAIDESGGALSFLRESIAELGSPFAGIIEIFEDGEGSGKRLAEVLRPVDDAWRSMAGALDKVKGPLGEVKDALSPITDAFRNLGDAVGGSFGVIMDKIEPLIPLFVNMLLPGWAKFLELVGKLMPVVMEFGKDVIPAVAEALDKLAGIWATFFGGGDDEGPTIFTTVMEKAKELAEMLRVTLGDAIGKVVGLLKNLAEPAGEFAESAAKLAEKLLDNLKPALDDFAGVLNDTVLPALEPTFDLFKKLAGTVGNLVTSVIKVAGALGEELGPIFKTLAEDILPEAMKLWNDLATAFEEDLLPVIDKLIEALEKFLVVAIEKVSDLIQELLEDVLKPLISWTRENVLPVLVKLAELFGETIVEALGFLTDLLTGDFQGAWDRFERIGTGIALLMIPLGLLLVWFTATAVVLPLVSIGFGILTGAVGAFGTVMALVLSPIFLIVAAIAIVIAIVILLAKNWDEITAFIQEKMEALKEFLVKALGAVGDFFEEKLEQIGDFFKTVFQTVLDFLKEHWPKILAILTGPFGLIVLAVYTFRDEILGAFQAMLNKVGDFFNMIGQIPGKIKAAMKNIPVLGGLAGAAGGLFGNQRGGLYRVGGVGSAERIVALSASPGEHVAVTPSGRGVGGGMTVQQTIVVEGSIVTERQLSELAVEALRDATRLNQSVLDVNAVVA
jgi:TP901 family phage tail tape measure protein